ncbi:MAG: lactate racemase domain-containing protein [Oscillospiraceae bacterium]|jgi:nickel-dependent lactate racemase|nr:lactate racemase domain-containing protein [Oscillospiraceae bacterium]
MHVKIAYGRTGIELDKAVSSAEVLLSRTHELSGGGDEDGLVRAAMAHPIGSPTLRELAIGKRTATILISDHTRPVPSQHILPFMLKELREGNPDIDVTLLVATGFHRETTPEELVSKVGREIYERERIVVHDCQDDANCIPVGVLPSGAPLDQNVYQSVKGLTAAEAAAAPDGILIICAACEDGVGGEWFYHALKTCEDGSALLRQIRNVPMEETQPDQWQYQILLRIMAHHRIIFVSDPKTKTIIEDIKLEYAPTLEEALERAFAEKGEQAHLVVIPDGISVVVTPEA